MVSKIRVSIGRTWARASSQDTLGSKSRIESAARRSADNSRSCACACEGHTFPEEVGKLGSQKAPLVTQRAAQESQLCRGKYQPVQ